MVDVGMCVRMSAHSIFGKTDVGERGGWDGVEDGKSRKENVCLSKCFKMGRENPTVSTP